MAYTPKHREYDEPSKPTTTVADAGYGQEKHRVAAPSPPREIKIDLDQPTEVVSTIPSQFVDREGYVDVLNARKAGVPMDTLAQATGSTVNDIREIAVNQIEYERAVRRIETQKPVLEKLENYKIDLTPTDKHRANVATGWDLVGALRGNAVTETELLDAGFSSTAIRQSKQVAKALNDLAPYTRADGIDVVDAVAANKRDSLRVIGVTNAQIASAAATVAKNKYFEKVAGSEVDFLKETTQDQIMIAGYAGLPRMTNEERKALSQKINELQKAGVKNPWWEAKSPEEKQAILEYYNTLSGTQKLFGEKLTKAEEARLPGYKQAGKMVVGLIPVVGTIVYWNEMSPVWKGISVAADVAFIASVTRLPKLVSGFLKIPGKQNVDDLIKVGRNLERSTIKRYLPQALSKYDDWVKASEAYAQNMVDLLGTQKLSKLRPGGALPEDLTAIQIAQERMRDLRLAAIKAGDTLADASKTPLARENFGLLHVKSLEDAITRVYHGKIPTYTKLQQQYAKLSNDLTEAIALVDKNGVTRIQYQMAELKGKLKLSISKELIELAQKRTILLNKIDKAKIGQALKLKRQLASLDKELGKFYAELPVAWAEPLSQGGGNIVTRPYPFVPAGGGGGTKLATEVPMLAPAVSTQIIPGTSHPYQIIWVTPSVYPRIVGQLETILGSQRVITKPRPEIKPWITIPDEDDPKVKLLPVIITLPSPLAGIDAYTKTYNQTQAAISEAISRTKAQPLEKTATTSDVATVTSTGTSPKSRVVVSSTPIIVPSTGTETAPATTTGTQATTIPETQTEPATKTKTSTKIVTPVTTTTTTTEPPFTPDIIVLPNSGNKKDKELTASEKKGATAWAQGFGWWIIFTRKGKKYAFFHKGEKPPSGIRQVKGGKGEAYRSIQQFRGEGTKFKFPMGVVNVGVEEAEPEPGKRGAIRFTPTRPRITAKRPSIR